jgi:hypothetical protein
MAERVMMVVDWREAGGGVTWRNVFGRANGVNSRGTEGWNGVKTPRRQFEL